MTDDVVLVLSDVAAHYGHIQALRGVSLTVRAGELVCLLGGNGAGKSTTIQCCSGLHRPTSGGIRFLGEDITAVPAHRIVERGLVQVPEGRRIFPRLSVEENLAMGAWLRRDRDGVKRDQDKVYSLFPVLAERRRQEGGTLSGGEQQMLAMGRALLSAPKLLLLDEPSMGVAPLVTERIAEVIRDLNRDGLAILLVEQNARMALGLASRAYVLETGRMVAEGDAQELASDPRVIAAYLGE